MTAELHQDKRRSTTARRVVATVTRGDGPPEPPSGHRRRDLVTRPVAMLTGMAAATVLAAACSSSPPAPSVASLPGHHAAHAATGQLTQAQSDQDMVDFARCMRAHGADIPDPSHRPGHAGLSVELPVPGPTVPATVRAALHVCNHFMQPIIQMKEAGQQALAAPRLRALTNYARCMRVHDIPMLDPNSFGALNLGNPPGVSGNFGRYTPQFHTADAACRHLLPAGVADNGTGP